MYRKGLCWSIERLNNCFQDSIKRFITTSDMLKSHTRIIPIWSKTIKMNIGSLSAGLKAWSRMKTRRIILSLYHSIKQIMIYPCNTNLPITWRIIDASPTLTTILVQSEAGSPPWWVPRGTWQRRICVAILRHSWHSHAADVVHISWFCCSLNKMEK